MQLLSPLSISGIREIFPSYKGFILDIIGVMHNGNSPFPQAVSCYQALYDSQKPLLFVSNTLARTAQVEKTLASIQVKNTRVLTSLESWITLLKDPETLHHFGLCPPVCLVGKNAILLEPLLDQNLASHAVSLAKAGSVAVMDQQDGNRTLVELCKTYGYTMAWLHPQAFSHAVRCHPLETLFSPTLPPHIIAGKPFSLIYYQALRYLGLASHEVLAIGDSFDSDVLGALCHDIDCLWIHPTPPKTLPSWTQGRFLKRRVYTMQALAW